MLQLFHSDQKLLQRKQLEGSMCTLLAQSTLHLLIIITNMETHRPSLSYHLTEESKEEAENKEEK